MARHARLSPSKADRWVTCPGSVPFEESVREQIEKLREGKPESSPAAAKGTEAHEYAEAQILASLHPEEFVRDEMRENARIIRNKMDDAFIENAEVYAEWATGFVFTRPNIPWGVELSAPLWYEPESKGTADFWAVDGDTLVVVDYKSGRVRVPVENNLQVLIYLIAIYTEIRQFNPQIKRFRAGIMQPFTLPHGRREPIWWDFDMGEMLRMQEVISAAAKEVDDPIAGQHRLVVSEKGCRFCPAKPFCPAQRDLVDDFVGYLDEEPEALDGTTLFGIYDKLKIYRSFLDSVEDYVRDQEDETLEKNGLVRKEGSKRREWNGPEEALAKSLETVGVEPYVKVLKTPAKVEKELGTLDAISSLVKIDFNRPRIVSTKAGAKTFRVSRKVSET